jgi:uncharacterized membrane protein
MNPFDVRSVLLAKHAQHVVIVHFLIALSLMSLLFDILARWWHRGEEARTAGYNAALVDRRFRN